MTALTIALLAELFMGGGIVEAECRGCHEWEQVAVACTVRSRVRRTGQTAAAVMTAPGQYARPVGPPRMRLRHIAAYARGRWGGCPTWAEGATHFVTRRRWPAVESRWLTHLEVAESGRTAHVFLWPREG